MSPNNEHRREVHPETIASRQAGAIMRPLQSRLGAFNRRLAVIGAIAHRAATTATEAGEHLIEVATMSDTLADVSRELERHSAALSAEASEHSRIEAVRSSIALRRASLEEIRFRLRYVSRNW
jgi:isochorismate hydrolase